MSHGRRLRHIVDAILDSCGFSSLDILNWIVPRSGYTLHRDIAYGKHARHHLDVYVPDAPAPCHPAIVFFYGGSWQWGSKSHYRFIAQAFATRGLTTVIPDYRVYPEVYFPAFMEDAAEVVAWTRAHIKQFGSSPDNLFLSGHSAGGYIAVMLTLNRTYLQAAKGDTTWIKGIIGIAGPYDFLPIIDPGVKAVFSKAAEYETQPINFVRPDLPPFLLAAGQEDTRVLARNTVNLVQKLRDAGQVVEDYIYPDINHTDIVLSLARGFRNKTPLLEKIAAFVTRASSCPPY